MVICAVIGCSNRSDTGIKSGFSVVTAEVNKSYHNH